jgi:iron complex transport system substrate-binding protein
MTNRCSRPGLILILTLALFACLPLASPASAKTVMDSTGRQVTVPDKITRVFAAGPPAAALLYALAPQDMVGWVHAPDKAAQRFLLPATRDLPETGRLTGQGNGLKLDKLKAAKPDIIIDFGTVDDRYKALADRIQSQTGIPYLLIDGRLDKTAAALRLLGGILGVQQRGEVLARSAEAILADVDHVLAVVPQAKRPHVYLARGADGLETGIRGSITAEIIERAGAINVADASGGKGSLLKTSTDQVARWAPDTIITLDRGFQQKVLAVKSWQPVPAIASGRVFLAPSQPFGFIDEPPSINRLIGLTWLMHIFYPSVATGDLRVQVREFYHQFYQVNLSDTDLRRLMTSAGD